MGYLNNAVCAPHQHSSFPGGFAVSGRVTVNSQLFVAEGESPRDAANIDIACAALPDDRTMVVFQRAKTIQRVWLREVKGLFLQIPNDIFNNMNRQYYHTDGEMTLPACQGKEENHIIPGNWLNVGNQLGVVSLYGEKLSIYRPADRQITIKSSQYQPYAMMGGGNLYTDEICCGSITEERAYDGNTCLFDIGAAVMAGANAAATAEIAATATTLVTTASPNTRAISITGADNRRYLTAVNFGESPITESFDINNSDPEVLTGSEIITCEDGKLVITIPAGKVAVIRL
jgi:hypothetical protein